MTRCFVNHHITGYLVLALVSTDGVMTGPAIDNPASYKLHSVVRFLHGKNMSAEEFRRVLCSVYGQNVMSEGTVRHWLRTFRDRGTNVHYEEGSGRAAICTE
jgi:hypothetical protein